MISKKKQLNNLCGVGFVTMFNKKLQNKLISFLLQSSLSFVPKIIRQEADQVERIIPGDGPHDCPDPVYSDAIVLDTLEGAEWFRKALELDPQSFTLVLEIERNSMLRSWCQRHWTWDIDRPWHIDEFAEVWARNVEPASVYWYKVGDTCPEIRPDLTPDQCYEAYLELIGLHYQHLCMRLGQVDHELNKVNWELSYLQEITEYFPAILDLYKNVETVTSILYTNSIVEYSLWFSVNKSLLSEEYLQIGLFFGVTLFLAILAVTASYLSATRRPDPEKLSTYECGFEPYEGTKNRFNVQFYIVAILFVLFDIEIILLLPWCLSLSTISPLGYWSMIEFLLELGLGFVYAWCIGVLDW